MNTITPSPIPLNVQGSTTIRLSAQSQTVSLSGASEAHIIRGISPTVDLEAVSGGTQMTVTDIDGEHTATIYNGLDGAAGQDGQDGEDGADGNGIASVTLNDDYTLTIAFTDGTEVTTGSIRGAQGEPGQDGADGSDGNPGVDGTSAYVHIKYAAAQPTQDSDMKDTADAWMGVYGGTSSTAPTAYTSYTWYNIKGAAGSNGTNGTNGQDGHSPVVTASKSGGVTTVYVDGTSVATISDGEDGQDGANGTDGHSPVVTASKSGTVTTIYVDGTSVATINDGADGAPGAVQSIQMNGSTVALNNGVADLGTVITSHQDISGKANKDTVGIVEDGDNATHNISIGQYVIWKGSLYIASSSIASGAALSSSNLTAKTDGIGGELASHIVPTYHGGWNTYPGAKGRYVYYYEGASTSTYSIPAQNCIVVVEWYSTGRGIATAYRWASSSAAQQYLPKMWINTRHDSWQGWKNITEAQDISSAVTVTSTKGTISQKSVYKSGNVVTIAFVFTASAAINSGTGLGISLSFSYSGFAPKLRSPASSSSTQVGGLNTTSNAFNASAISNISKDAAFWLCSTYICSD